MRQQPAWLLPVNEEMFWLLVGEVNVTPLGLLSGHEKNGEAGVCWEQGEPLAADCGSHCAMPARQSVANTRLKVMILRMVVYFKKILLS